MARIILAGEAMLELSRQDADWKLGFGGDTLNTAIHLARSGHDVGYLTVLGDDPFSEQMRSAWAAEGLDGSFVLTHPTRQAGLYAISTDAAGERTFTYWRDFSAARELFELPAIDAAIARAQWAQLLCFSLISLAILPPDGRSRLLELAWQVKGNGGQVAFDGNYRPRLWTSAVEAAQWRDAAIATADIGLPTLEDETLLSGSIHDDEVAGHWQSLGCEETIVKLGAAGCRLPDGTLAPPQTRLSPVDTSGAGDAFNAGYLAARMNGAAIAQAAAHGHALAGWSVMRRGAIPPRDGASPY